MLRDTAGNLFCEWWTIGPQHFKITRHCWDRLLQRQLTVFDLAVTLQRGTITEINEAVLQFSFGCIHVITDATAKICITAYKETE